MKKQIWNLLLLLYQISFGFSILMYPFSLNTTFYETTLQLYWDVDWDNQNILFHVVVPIATIEKPMDVLIGFSDHGFIAGSDFCLYRSAYHQVQSIMYDGWIDKKKLLHSDLHNDCNFVNEDSDEKQISFYFERKFFTCDSRDYAFETGTTNILLAVGYNKIIFINESSIENDIFYKIRYTQILQRRKDPPNNNVFNRYEPQKILEIRTQNISIPPQVTTYWCQSVELDKDIRQHKHHIIQYEAAISKGMENIVHHFEVFHCQKPVGKFSGFCTDSHSKPAAARSCSKVIAAWAMGAEAIIYPPEAGMPLGGKNFVPYLMIEIHYNNPEKLDKLIDNSGIRIHYTNKLRRYDAGIMELGLIYSDANSIPPQQSEFQLTGYCVADCTKKLPPQGISVFATQLHAHLTGRKLFTSHFRDGIKIGELNRENHYSPHWQHIEKLHNHIRVMPGDVLTTTCVYNTKNRTSWTWGGYGIEDEMCVNYVHYYPAAEMEVCKSAIDNSTLHSLFRKLDVTNKTLKIHEKYLAVKWTPAKLNLLREHYHVAPLNIACLDHSGDLFKGHPTNWQKVKRPETFAGIYTRTRSTDECFAIND